MSLIGVMNIEYCKVCVV
uniref:Uncharacterized protein n=1 Tax=Rhizophora mucronata TaxID=61149 RepID=A0A2P2PFT5_RHIMU